MGNMPVSFREFLKYSSSTSDDMPLYLFDKHFLNTAPQLADDFCIPEVFTEDLFSVLGAKRPDYRCISGPTALGARCQCPVLSCAVLHYVLHYAGMS